jgi:hypothetical protein
MYILGETYTAGGNCRGCRETASLGADMASEAQEEHGGEELHLVIDELIVYSVVLYFEALHLNVNGRLKF